MSTMKLTMRNYDAAYLNLAQYPERVRRRARAVVGQSRDRAQAMASALCPYDANELDDFHMIDVLRTVESPSGLSYEIGFFPTDFRSAGQPLYYFYTEYGTSRMAAQPCIRPTREQEYPRFRRELRTALRDQR